MDNYIVSALKYRPTTFQSVIGQKALTTTLKNAILSNKLAHAYLFCGPRGVGKTTCARIFAKTINCTNLNAEGEACNECESCRSFNEQRSLNIYELDAASNNSVEDIRTLIEQVRIPPQQGKYKVYIIDEVHMLSTAAFNAFLKTLEEPPHYVIFILATTEKHKVLPTILSRCQIYDFSRISVKDIVDHLAYVAEQEHIKADRDALNIIAMKADGGMRDSLSIFDQAVSFTGGNITYQNIIENLNVLDYDYYFRLTDLFLKNDVSGSLLLFNEILNKGFEGNRFIGGLASHFRNLLVSKDEETVQLLEVSDNIRQRYIAQSQQCTVKFLYRAIRLCNDCDINYRTSQNKRLLVELTLIELAQITDTNTLPEPRVIPPIKPIDIKNNLPQQSQPSAAPEIKSVPPVHQVPDNAAAEDTAGKQTMSDFLKIKSQKSNDVQVVNMNELGISIHSNNDSTENVSENVKEQEVVTGNEPINDIQLRQKIRRFAASLPIEQKALSIQLPEFTLMMNAPTQFEFVVDNDFAANELGEILVDLQHFLCKELNNSQLSLSVRVSATNESKKPIGRKERFMYMAEKNPNLIELQKKFGLELS